MIIFLFKGSSNKEFRYMAKFAPENEITSVIGSHDRTSWSILPWSYKIINLSFVLKKKIRQCNATTTRLTPCIMKGYEKLFGNSFKKEVEKYTNLTDFIFSDTDGLLSLTNCLPPCETIDYQTNG